MKILISGAAGYIGSTLVKQLLNNTHQITCLDNLMFNQNDSSLIKNKNINFIKGDVRDKFLMKDLIKKNDLFIPLAAIVGAPLSAKMPKETKETYIEGLRILSDSHVEQPLAYTTMLLKGTIWSRRAMNLPGFCHRSQESR